MGIHSMRYDGISGKSRNLLMKDEVPELDERRMEIMATDLRVHQEMPLVSDTSLVSPLQANGDDRPAPSTRPRAARPRAVVIENTKTKTHLELLNSSRCKFLVLAGEVGGRWRATTCQLIRDLATAKSEEVAQRLRQSTAFEWENR